MRRRVIAVAAPIGGGKSTLVNALAVALGNENGPAPSLRFDDYEGATQLSVEQLGKWVADGANFDKLTAPGLANDLKILRCGGVVDVRGDALQVTLANTASTDLVFEMPLGRQWSATAADIDVLVWVDVPLDIALARRLREISAELLQRSPEAMRDGIGWMSDYLGHYIQTIHAVLEVQQRLVKARADVVLDGRKAVDTMVRYMMNYLGRQGQGL